MAKGGFNNFSFGAQGIEKPPHACEGCIFVTSLWYSDGSIMQEGPAQSQKTHPFLR